jgi:hypothetical protein
MKRSEGDLVVCDTVQSYRRILAFGWICCPHPHSLNIQSNSKQILGLEGRKTALHILRSLTLKMAATCSCRTSYPPQNIVVHSQVKLRNCVDVVVSGGDTSSSICTSTVRSMLPLLGVRHKLKRTPNVEDMYVSLWPRPNGAKLLKILYGRISQIFFWQLCFRRSR